MINMDLLIQLQLFNIHNVPIKLRRLGMRSSILFIQIYMQQVKIQRKLWSSYFKKDCNQVDCTIIRGRMGIKTKYRQNSLRLITIKTTIRE